MPCSTSPSQSQLLCMVGYVFGSLSPLRPCCPNAGEGVVVGRGLLIVMWVVSPSLVMGACGVCKLYWRGLRFARRYCSASGDWSGPGSRPRVFFATAVAMAPHRFRTGRSGGVGWRSLVMGYDKPSMSRRVVIFVALWLSWVLPGPAALGFPSAEDGRLVLHLQRRMVRGWTRALLIAWAACLLLLGNGLLPHSTSIGRVGCWSCSGWVVWPGPGQVECASARAS